MTVYPQADNAARIVVDNLQRFALIKNRLGKTRNRKYSRRRNNRGNDD
jgi:hypothetical protein